MSLHGINSNRCLVKYLSIPVPVFFPSSPPLLFFFTPAAVFYSGSRLHQGYITAEERIRNHRVADANVDRNFYFVGSTSANATPTQTKRFDRALCFPFSRPSSLLPLSSLLPRGFSLEMHPRISKIYPRDGSRYTSLCPRKL